MLIYEYETFKCKPNERVTDMTNRIMDIITNLKKLGKIYSKTDINHKILRALPKKLWESKVTSIKEANDLSVLAHDELIGKLLTYEMENDEDEKEDKKKTIAFNVEQEDKPFPKERNFHHQLKEESSESESQLDDSEVEQLSREYALLMKKADLVMKRSGRTNFKKFLKNRNKVTCYECGRSGHVRSECYKLKREGSSSKKPKEQKEPKE